MSNLQDLVSKGDNNTIWQKYCGFIDLSLEEFMEIQESLLLEQIEQLDRSKLGKILFGNNKPKSIEEFRKNVPLTTYDFYDPYFNNQDDSMLPEKPQYWICTTWKGGTHPYKWAPYTSSMVKENIKAFIASLLFATCNGKKFNVTMKPKDKFLYGMAPLPYFTGIVPYGLKHEFEFEYLPDIQTAENIGFEERNMLGFQLGLEKGIDIFFGVSSVLLRIGEKFQEGFSSNKTINGKKSLKASLRLLKGLIKSKLHRRNILPKDIWKLKGIVCGGTDTRLYKDKIESYWGVKPLEAYAGTEISIVATQTLNYKGLTFFPDVNFLEFISEGESHKNLIDPSYKPKTLLLNEVEAGGIYELVTTKFKGGAFVRYRVGDLIKIISLTDKKLGIKVPQMEYVDRVNSIIDLSAFTRISEGLLSKAIKLASIDCNKWFASKGINANNEPYLHLHIEQNQIKLTQEEIKELLHYYIGELDDDYKNLESMLGRKPIEVTLLSMGTWKKFRDMNKDQINTINPKQSEIAQLVTVSERLTIPTSKELIS